MRLGAIADLHIDLNRHYTPKDYLTALTQQIQHAHYDHFVIAGDISNQQTVTLAFIRELEQQSVCPIYYVPGNHDLWEEAHATPKHTWAIFERYLEDPHCLIHHPAIISDHYALVGHMGWYNYAYASSQFTPERLATGRYKLALWQDKRHLDFGESDPAISKQFADELRMDLESVASSQIILVTHIPSHPAMVPPLPDRRFDFYNAYLATSDLYPLYQTYDIHASIMGHLHHRMKKYVDNTTLYCSSLGYYQQWATHSLRQEIATATVECQL
ncbi:MAG: metallophosphoesterase [Aerococcus sp.]|nr:metallophosphoesterase [Aerococcus sp.]